MAQAEVRLWWYCALHHLVERALSRHPRRLEARIVDAGCGTGGLLMSLRELGYKRISGFDVSSDAVAICKARELEVVAGDLRCLDVFAFPLRPDAIVSNDTLYFFPDEEQRHIVKLCAEALNPGGLLIFNVPALGAFSGIHDRSVGITRRFSKRDVRTLVSSAGLSLCELRYWPFFVSPLIYFVRLRQRWRLKLDPGAPVRSDVDLPPKRLNALLESITRIEVSALPWQPFGSSLFAVARKA